MYDATMTRIKSQVERQSDLGIRALQWITFAQRPLSPVELQHALAIEPGNSQLDEEDEIPEEDDMLEEDDLLEDDNMLEDDEDDDMFETLAEDEIIYNYISWYKGNTSDKSVVFVEGDRWIKDNISDIQDILSACAGLVTIDEGKNIVRLIHYTTKEYLEQTQSHWFHDCQARMTLSCVTYLSFYAFNNHAWMYKNEFDKLIKSSQFFEYSAENWGKHAQQVGIIDEELRKAVTSFLASEGNVRSATRLLNVRGIPHSERLCEGNLLKWTGIHLAAFFDLKEVVKLLRLTKKFDLNQQDVRGFTPLTVAAWRGNGAVAKLLLDDNNIDVNNRGKYGYTALHVAVMNGQANMVKILLGNDKVNVDSKDQWDQTPLWVAAGNGHENIVKILLDSRRANPDTKSTTYGELSPLAEAAGNGHLTIVRHLLAIDGVDANSRDDIGNTPLHHAVMFGELEVVQELLLHTSSTYHSREITLLVSKLRYLLLVFSHLASPFFLAKPPPPHLPYPNQRTPVPKHFSAHKLNS